MNIGVRTLQNGATMTIYTYNANGGLVGTRTGVSYPANYFEQKPATEFTGVASLPPGGTIKVLLTGTSNRALVYSSVIDNRTSDPTFRLAGAR
jgi:hypothetical protein